MTVALNVTKRYSVVDAWFYDTIVAPALAAMKPDLAAEVVAALPANAQVLDVGSGGGQLCVALAERGPGLCITGLDISADQVRRARRRAAPLGERVRFVENTAMDLPFPDESFDATISYGSIKHWPDRARGVAEMLRVLRPGGLFLLVELDRDCSLDDARRYIARWRLPRPARAAWLPVFRRFIAGGSINLEQARALIADRPLKDVTVQRIPGEPGLEIIGHKSCQGSGAPRNVQTS
jgi:ubiquinone/menaquinone biosynthesis C-methylase UbiE